MRVSERLYKKAAVAALLMCFPLFLSGQEIIEKIEIAGNKRIPCETIFFYLFMKEGRPFDREYIRKDFKALWSTGFFSDIKIEEKEGTKGKIIKIIVEENPLLKEITYNTGKKLREDEIVRTLKQKNEYILPYSVCNPYKIQKIKKTIEDLLLEKRLPFGKVEAVVNEKGKHSVGVIFNINEGPQFKVSEVVFEGELKIPEKVLRASMKGNKKHGIKSWLTGKDVFSPDKLDEDLANIKYTLQEFGYMEAAVGKPVIEDVQKRSILLKRQKMKKIIIPVHAGSRYRVGEVRFEGNSAFTVETLGQLIKFKEGEIYSVQTREENMEDISKFYRNEGYFFARIIPVEMLDRSRKLVNLTFKIFEGEVVYLKRLEFMGNTFTKDKVMRREMLLREGERFNLDRFKDGLLRIQKLGIMGFEKEPEIRHNADDSNKVDVTLHVVELQKSNIWLSGGYNGYGGTYIALDSAVVNYLGLGESLRFKFDHGERSKNYKFDFSFPYFLDCPATLAFAFFDRDILFRDIFWRKGKGLDFALNARIGEKWRAELSYRYEDVDIEFPDTEMRISDQGIDPVYLSPFGIGNYDMSQMILSLFRSTLDNPLFPTNGSLCSTSCTLSGSFLGGDIELYSPRFEWSLFQPLVFKHVFGFHLEYRFIKAISDSQVPFWERFYLGGERSIRGYDAYSIGPRSDEGTNFGGSKSFVLNAEYIIPVGGPLYAVLFYDLGNVYSSGQNISFKGMYASTGLEMRITFSALPVPIRFIFAYNNRKIQPDDSHFAFRFALGAAF